MTKDELQAKREVALSELKNIEVALCLDEHYIDIIEKENAEIWGNLTKAKELLMKWVELFKPKGGNIPPTPIQVDTEQFLKETEKC